MKSILFWTRVSFAIAVMSIGGLAQAGGSSGGHYYGYSSSGGGYTASHGGSNGGHVGPIRRFLAKLHAHKASHGSSGGYASFSGSSGGYASYSGSSGGYASVHNGGSSGGYSSSYYGGSSGGYSFGYYGGSSGGYAAMASYGHSIGASYIAPMTNSHSSPVYESSSIQSSYPVEGGIIMSKPQSLESSIAQSQTQYAAEKPTLDDDAALLTVAVPDDKAVVTVNDHPTTSAGMVRQFMSRGLKDGYVYTYVVKVKYTLDGKEVTDEKQVKLRPGNTERLVFEPKMVESADVQEPGRPEVTDQVSTVQDKLETVVQIRVPADAEVTLAGNPTKGHGTLRTFRTKTLKAGEAWNDYTVTVTVMIDGRLVTKQQTVDVLAGKRTELAFDFDATSVAAR
jgi:uncharacterized protein (TIGR03000 family)